VLRGKKELARAGKRRLVPARYLVNEAEAELVRLIFAEYLKPNASLRGVVQLLNGRGIPAPGLAKGCAARGSGRRPAEAPGPDQPAGEG
jgi:hypothetical protein